MNDVLALDVGGTSIKSARVSLLTLDVFDLSTTDFDSSAPWAEIRIVFAGVLNRHISDTKRTLQGVAVGFPGPFDYERGICLIRDLDKFEQSYGVDVGAELRELSGGLPVRFRNDAEAAIVGEGRFGLGRTCRRIIGLTLGTGFGSAFLLDGKRLATGVGIPEGGWLYPILFQERPADDVFSRRGIEARLKALRMDLDVKEAAMRARSGDQILQQMWSDFGADLGTFLIPFVHNFCPDRLLLLGRIADAFDLFGSAIAERVPTKVAQGSLGPKAALLGAAELFAPIPQQ